MTRQSMDTLTGELRKALTAGAFTRRGRVALSDGVTVDPERMARIILVDIEHLAQGRHADWITKDEEQRIYDDLLCLLAVTHRSGRLAPPDPVRIGALG